MIYWGNGGWIYLSWEKTIIKKINMKLIKKALGNTIQMTKNEWEKIGNDNGWMKKAKWKGDAEIEQTGEWTNYTIEELKSKRDNLKKKQENYKEKNNGKAKKEYTEKLREINFAIRSKGGWKKGEGAAD